MDLINAEAAMKELTMALIYLSRFCESNRFRDEKDYYAWKGYNFDILNELDEMISSGRETVLQKQNRSILRPTA